MKRSLRIGLCVLGLGCIGSQAEATAAPLRTRVAQRWSKAVGWVLGQTEAERALAKASPSVRAVLERPNEGRDRAGSALAGVDHTVWSRLASAERGQARFHHPIKAGPAAGAVELVVEARASAQTGYTPVGIERSEAPLKSNYYKSGESFTVQLAAAHPDGSITPAMEADLNQRMRLAQRRTHRDPAAQDERDHAFDNNAFGDKGKIAFRFHEENRGASAPQHIANRADRNGVRDGDVFLSHLLDAIKLSPSQVARELAKQER
jgi:hypothetical protein